MFDAGKLYKQRLKTHLNLLNRYLRYIFNGHFMIALMFLIVTLAVYYQQALMHLHDDFPSALVIAIVLGIVAGVNPLQSFLQEPDKVFLIVKENAMKAYFIAAIIYNFVMQLYIVIFVFSATMPLYTKAYPEKAGIQIILLLLLLLLMKAWNMVIQWQMMRIRHPFVRSADKWLRGLLGILLLYTFITERYFIYSLMLYIIIALVAWYMASKQSGLAWDVLIENDRHRLVGFYRFVSMFADVPQLQKPLRKRRGLAKLVNKSIPFKTKGTYDYLYWLTFIRSSDYFMMYLRLIVIGGILIIYIPSGLLKVIFALLFIYLTSFQLIALYHHYETMIWLDLYPVAKTAQQAAFIKLLYKLTLGQLAIFTSIFFLLKQYQHGLIILFTGVLFAYLFVYRYVKNKIMK